MSTDQTDRPGPTPAVAGAAPIGSSAADADVEAALIDAAAAGDGEAFARLYDLYVGRLYRYVYLRVGNESDAEDLTQQIFLQAWRAIGRYRRTRAPFVAWLLVIAHNLVVSFYRGQKDVRRLAMEPANEARWANPEEETLAAQEREAVRRAVARLNPDQQQVVTMRYLEQCDHSTIAAVLGKSEGTVRVILHRALRALRDLLSPEVAG
jgi:RNA polymerase sigma-70 factor (ECF subfamily)